VRGRSRRRRWRQLGRTSDAVLVGLRAADPPRRARARARRGHVALLCRPHPAQAQRRDPREPSCANRGATRRSRRSSSSTTPPASTTRSTPAGCSYSSAPSRIRDGSAASSRSTTAATSASVATSSPRRRERVDARAAAAGVLAPGGVGRRRVRSGSIKRVATAVGEESMEGASSTSISRAQGRPAPAAGTGRAGARLTRADLVVGAPNARQAQTNASRT